MGCGADMSKGAEHPRRFRGASIQRKQTLVSMMTSVCLRWMDAPRNRRGCSAPLLISAPHPIGLTKDVGTDVQLARLRRVQVDVEADAVVLGKELDGAGVIAKVRGLSHGEHGSASELIEQIALTALFSRRDEQQMARLQVLVRVQ